MRPRPDPGRADIHHFDFTGRMKLDFRVNTLVRKDAVHGLVLLLPREVPPACCSAKESGTRSTLQVDQAGPRLDRFERESRTELPHMKRRIVKREARAAL